MSTTTSETSGVLKTAAVVILLLVGLGFAVSQGWINPGQNDPEPETPREDLHLVVLSAAWGHFEETLAGRQFVSDDRDLTITYWVDGERFAATRDDGPGEPWNEYLAVPSGTSIRLLVEQHDRGGLLMCSISADGKTLLPNGYMHRNDAGDCDVNGIVP